MSRIRAEVDDLVEHLNAGREPSALLATADPSWAETHRPCVLVAPPTLDLQARACRHRVFALSGHNDATEAAQLQLADLVDAVDAQLPGHVERAEPATYGLTSSAGTVPAYLLTITTSY